MKRILTVTTALIVVCAMSFTVIGDYSYAAGGKIGMAKAKKIAFKNAKVKRSQVRNLEVDYDNDDAEYEIEFIKKKTGAEFNYKINAYSGKILKKSVERRYTATTSQKKIGKTKARKKAAKFLKVKYSTVKRGTCRFEKKARGSRYEIKFKKGKYRYECEVLASSGKVIEYEYKYVGK